MKTLEAKQQGQYSELRGRKLRNAVLVAAFMAVLTSFASADIYGDLTTNLYYPNCLFAGACSANTGGSGSPATGSADFNSLPPNNPPWSFSFQTGSAVNWSYLNGHYSADFNSGTFDMNGPYGLTFTGTISQASAFDTGISGSFGVTAYFSGYWSDGIYGSGVAYVEGTGSNWQAYLNTAAQAPEPSSLMMFGSGILGLGGLLRKRFLG